jgi:hypothetical protein
MESSGEKRAKSCLPEISAVWAYTPSSGVEGRNGQLALHHHGRHRLSDRKLAALTAVHNYHIRRADDTTAAERFFGRAHETLFAQVLQRMPLPPHGRHADDPDRPSSPT